MKRCNIFKNRLHFFTCHNKSNRTGCVLTVRIVKLYHFKRWSIINILINSLISTFNYFFICVNIILIIYFILNILRIFSNLIIFFFRCFRRI